MKRIKLNLGVTLPTSVQFQMVRIDVGMEQDIGDSLDVEKAQERLAGKVLNELNKRIEQLLDTFKGEV